MAAPVQIVIAHTDASVRSTLSEAIEGCSSSDGDGPDNSTYEVCASIDTRAKLERHCKVNRPDLIVCGVQLADGDAIELLVKIGETAPIPAIIVTDKDSLGNVEHALEDHVMAYLIEPIDVEQIQPTIYLVLRRFEQFQALLEQVQDLRQALADRKIIERAKGILMSQGEMDETDAFQRLQRMATDKRKKLVEIAQAIVTAQEAMAK
jgi:response regulator NasT